MYKATINAQVQSPYLSYGKSSCSVLAEAETEFEIYERAFEVTENLVKITLEYGCIVDPIAIESIRDSATHEIVWEEMPAVGVFAVLDVESDNPVLAIFGNYPDAEEFLISYAEEAVYEIMMGDPMEVIEVPSWHWKWDWNWLMKDCLETFKIIEVPAFGVEVEE